MSLRSLLRHLPVALSVHHWHAQCVMASDHWQAWRRVYARHRRRLASASAAFHHGLLENRNGRVHGVRGARQLLEPFNPQTWQPERREMIWYSNLGSGSGWRNAGRQLLLAMERQGVRITIAPTVDQSITSSPGFIGP